MPYFPDYAERIGFVSGQKYDVEKSESDSVKMLSGIAKETGVWLVGGERTVDLEKTSC